ncbi:MAG: carbohydrate-binding domain-containing protein [Clostridia bacterium]|nr:carbohydrate-binding domain-containing protein [Clostridia bacterium]
MKKNNRKTLSAILAILLCLGLLTSCKQDKVKNTQNSISVKYDSYDEDQSYSNENATFISLNGSSAEISGSGAKVNGSNVVITDAGTYVLSGTLANRQIKVNSQEIVKLVLNGADIICENTSPIYIEKSKKTIITSANGTQNSVTDGSEYTFENTEEKEPNAAIFSKSDLTINGGGALLVNANYNDAVKSKDELKIVGANITINAVGDGIIGKDFLAAKGAEISINTQSEGLKSTNDTDTKKGFILLENSNIDITSTEDAVQAQTNALINGGTIVITAGGGSGTSLDTQGGIPDGGMIQGNLQDGMPPNDMHGGMPDNGSMHGSIPGEQPQNDSSAASMKGIKAGMDLTVSNGSILINSADDCIHSGGNAFINGGTLALSSGDDGIHADSKLEINGGDVNISKSYEGIEGSVVSLNGGTVHIKASDDGVNVAGGNDSNTSSGSGRQDAFAVNENNYLYINGGYIYVDASGDGLDSNGYIEMNGGTAIVSGPINGANAAVDYNGTFNMSGGFLAAAGSAGMAETLSDSSSQYSLMLTFDSALAAGTVVHIEGGGENILTFAPAKQYQTLILCSPKLKNGSSYSVYTGGNVSGTPTDTIYPDNSVYTDGTKYADFTVSSIVTTIGSAGGNMPGGGGMRGGGGPRSAGTTQGRGAPQVGGRNG